jgi:hypothetical protein
MDLGKVGGWSGRLWDMLGVVDVNRNSAHCSFSFEIGKMSLVLVKCRSRRQKGYDGAQMEMHRINDETALALRKHWKRKVLRGDDDVLTIYLHYTAIADADPGHSEKETSRFRSR